MRTTILLLPLAGGPARLFSARPRVGEGQQLVQVQVPRGAAVDLQATMARASYRRDYGPARTYGPTLGSEGELLLPVSELPGVRVVKVYEVGQRARAVEGSPLVGAPLGWAAASG